MFIGAGVGTPLLMAYSIRRVDDTVLDALTRIAADQLDVALGDLDIGDDVSHDEMVEAIHDCRKRCKKLRGLVRLVRPALGEKRYKKANVTFRDAARELSPYRDDHALLSTFDDLVAAHADRIPDGGLGAIRAGLRDRARRSTETLAAGAKPVDRARRLLDDGRAQIDGWKLDTDGWDAMAGGIATTYERGRRALAVVRDRPDDGEFHELRKRVKYSWYHLRLVARTAPSIVEPLAGRFHDLSDGLGHAHDLVVLRSRILGDPEGFGGDARVRGAVELADGQRELLERRSIALARRLYSEKPKHFVRRLEGYWDAWSDGDAEPDVGEIADLAPVDGADRFGSSTVDQLRQIASDHDVPGRSSMRRDELVAALLADGRR